MASLKRWLARLLGLTVLVAAVWFAYDYARSRPRCVIVSDTHGIHFSNDGNTLITGFTGCRIGNRHEHGVGKPPMKIWDTRTGGVVRTLLDDAGAFEFYEVLPSHQLFAAALDRGIVRIANWRSGEEWSIEVGGKIGYLHFSPCGAWLAVGGGYSSPPVALVDLKRRELAKPLAEDAVGWGFEADGSLWYYSVGGRLYAWNPRKREVEASLQVDGSLEGHYLTIRPDDPWFAYRRPNDLSVQVFERRTLKPISRVRPDFKPAGSDLWTAFQWCEVTFSQSGRYMATLPNGAVQVPGMLEIWDVKSGNRALAIPELSRGWGWFVEDEIFLCYYKTPLADKFVISDEVAAVAVPSGKVLWRRRAELGKLFAFDSATGIDIGRQGNWSFFDAVTGETQRVLAHPLADGSFNVGFDRAKRQVYAYGPRQTPNLPSRWREHLARWLNAESGCVQIVDVHGRRAVLTLNIGISDGVELSGDGSTLVCFECSDTGAPAYHFRFHDLHSDRPWYWAAAAPTALLVLGLLWRTWRGRRRRQPAPGA